ncbi:MAG: hypothetical protein BWK78_08250 [Thiotrichaceae bacterium IS1]|nr:MAG: hypothetical protein BWK78_08250 [Thiotrichaceae bacterium IS1]
MMSQTLKNILKYGLEKPREITVQRIAEDLQLRPATVQKYFRQLKQAGRVAQFGPDSKDSRFRLMNPKVYFDNFLFVYKKHQLAGYLNFEAGQHEFAYDNNYLVQTDTMPISPDLDLTEKPFQSVKLFPAFEQLLPEGQDRKLLEIHAGSANDFDLLPCLQHLYGDLQFSRIPLNVSTINQVPTVRYTEVKKEILGQNVFPNILPFSLSIEESLLFPTTSTLETVAPRFMPSGLSGYQHKLPVVVDWNQQDIRAPQDQEVVHYFIKPYQPQKADCQNDYYFPHLAINEHLFMTFAKNELGLEVPYNGVVKRPFDKEYHYLVKRFDRYNGHKFAHTEFATLMGQDSESKYQGSSEKLFRRMKNWLPVAKERLRFLQYYFYSMLIVHEDLHTKNLSVLAEEKKLRIAPLYDITTTAIYQNAYGYETHLPINGKRTKIRPADFAILIDILEVNHRTFEEVASAMLFSYTHKLPEYFDKVQEAFPEARVYKISRQVGPGTGGRKQLTPKSSLSLADAFRKSYQERITQLRKLDWYNYLAVLI